ncbi:hypothetical protein F5B22DRAFT_9724 [Xylaria bambusicola]|uniref:uncharacterized protein n=1 Tax=Xylaria bambusicola TaxID=326684 RepID=UPI0020079FF3|nr:uncharacterized protein F5B22DRAFT_9724 [Xylaria bambusicola]KAI0527900.1 hypothetical protein F5B22DRAFT_9724 [Xylaria bambusicola]
MMPSRPLRRGWPSAADAGDAGNAGETAVTPLGRCGRWRRAHWDHWGARVTGPASALKLSRAVIFLLISCWLCLGAAAASISVDESPRPIVPAGAGAGAGVDTTDEALLIDPRIPVFVDGHWQIMSDEEHRELRRRADAHKETEEEEETDTETQTGAGTGTGTKTEKPKATKTTEIIINAATVTDSANPVSTTTAAASPLPSPFDGALAANFSGDNVCPTFINDFLSNATFRACYPISLLLQGSQSFFEAEKSFFSITQVLDAACKADVDMCTDYFNDLAKSLIATGNCGKEYDRENALVVQAYQGMKTYNTVYKATCLANEDSKSSEYCFANAITNSTTPSNAYLYYLPFNSTLPSTAAPACGSCTQQTMAIYQAATSNRKADISNTYLSAAEQINSNCGNNFVNTTLATAVDSGTMASLNPISSSLAILISFFIMAVSHWIL